MKKEQYDSLEACMADGHSMEECQRMMEPKEAVDAIAGTTQPSNPIKPEVSMPPTTSTGGSTAMPDNHSQKNVLGENLAQIKVERLRAEQKAAALEMQKAEVEAKLTEAYTQNATLTGQLAALKETLDKREKHIEALNKEKSIDTAELRSLNRRLEDMTGSRDDYKQQLETIKAKHEELSGKYSRTLQDNLALEQQLTKANEEYLSKAREADKTEEALRKAKNLAGKIRVIGLEHKT